MTRSDVRIVASAMALINIIRAVRSAKTKINGHCEYESAGNPEDGDAGSAPCYYDHNVPESEYCGYCMELLGKKRKLKALAIQRRNVIRRLETAVVSKERGR